jgi:ATP-dependent Clp protease ATP-binding subunit ClpC
MQKESKRDGAKKLPPTIAKYASPLFKSDRENDPAFCRDEEIGHIIRILSRKTKNNPCLLGEPGVGKTAVVEGLAKRIRENDVPDFLKGKLLLALDIPSMLAGAKYRGDFEERLKNVLSESAERSDLILFIDELHTVMGAGASEGAIDASNILKPALSRGGITLIGATTTDEYRKYIERDSAFERRFQPIQINEPDRERTGMILRGLKTRFEEHHGIKISDEAIDTSVAMSVRYFPNRRLPDKAIDLLDESASEKRLNAEKTRHEKTELNSIVKGISAFSDGDSYSLLAQGLKSKADEIKADSIVVLTEEDVKSTLSRKLGRDITHPIPADLKERLQAQIFGQDQAIDKICSTLISGMLSLSERNRPASVIMIYGESGVGKTELCRTLSEVLFGDNSLLRIDMAEYSEKHSISRLMGSPPGYVGYGEEGILTKWTRSNPHSLILFDNAEKAHPEILNIISTISESSALPCPNGKTADFKSAVIIVSATTKKKGYSAGFSAIESSDPPMIPDEAFSKGFLSKMDAVIPFSPLSASALKSISNKKLSEILYLLKKRGLKASFSDGMTEFILSRSKIKNDARSLSSFIKTNVEEKIAEYLYESDGSHFDKLEIFTKNGEIAVKGVTDLEKTHIMQ